MKSKYVLCDHQACPLKESCARYCPDMNRMKTNHIDPMPYDAARKRCGFYDPAERDEPPPPLNNSDAHHLSEL